MRYGMKIKMKSKRRKHKKTRKERDLSWVQSGRRTVLTGSHRFKKIHGIPKKEDGSKGAFWCPETDAMPKIAQLYYETPSKDFPE